MQNWKLLPEWLNSLTHSDQVTRTPDKCLKKVCHNPIILTSRISNYNRATLKIFIPRSKMNTTVGSKLHLICRIALTSWINLLTAVILLTFPLTKTPARLRAWWSMIQRSSKFQRFQLSTKWYQLFSFPILFFTLIKNWILFSERRKLLLLTSKLTQWRETDVPFLFFHQFVWWINALLNWYIYLSQSTILKKYKGYKIPLEIYYLWKNRNAQIKKIIKKKGLCTS